MINNEQVEGLLDTLNKINDSLKKTNDTLGYTERCENMKLEIKLCGWDRIKERYETPGSPFLNDKAAKEMYALYTYLYQRMVDTGEITV
jgi:CRISPR/Cas system CMR-associated protein Cmr1 (group 7 of RAMP superfamily)